MIQEPNPATEMFKALGDPIRWDILRQIAQQDELACRALEDTLPVSKPTISYHTKILAQAGLIEVLKRGRNYYYRARRDVLREMIDELWTLTPGPRLVGEPTARREPIRGAQPEVGPAPLRKAAGDDTVPPATLLTW